MKSNFITIGCFFLLLLLVSCGQNQRNESSAMYDETATETSDAPISIAASQEIEGKQFIRKADVNIEVENAYNSTIFIEEKLQNLGGFVTQSKLNTRLVSERTFAFSDEKAKLVRKYYTENSMIIKVPENQLSEFLKAINETSVFLHHRTIGAQDISISLQNSKLKQEALQKNKNDIDQLKNTAKSVELSVENQEKTIDEKTRELILRDELAYSSVSIYLRETAYRITEMEVANTNYFDKKFRSEFFYELKQSFSNGFVYFQDFVVAIANLWLFIIVGISVFWIWRKWKQKRRRDN